jgi:thiamine biosynthesis lipoprotein
MSTALFHSPNGFHRVEDIMGMPIGIDLRDLDLDPAVLDEAFDWLRRVDATFSTYKVESEMSRLNRGELRLDEADPDVRTVLQRCEQLRFQTGGYFDARAAFWQSEARTRIEDPSPAAVDPSGLVKGWAVDRAATILDAAGARNYCINAGGDVCVRGAALPDPYWRIGILHPLQHDQVAAVVQANDLGIATSGTYARGEHIVDPYNETPPQSVLSVTIVGLDLGTADAYATAAFAMGEEGPEWTAGLAGCEAMTILANETVLYTPGFPVAPEDPDTQTREL